MKGDPIFNPGDKVRSFRGDPATVVQMTRDASDPGRSAKVLVVWGGDEEYDGYDGFSGNEYYSNVFELAKDYGDGK